MKRTLANSLLERSATVEYRNIKKHLLQVAQNNPDSIPEKNCFRVIRLKESTILMLQNQGIKVDLVNEFGTDKYLLTW